MYEESTAETGASDTTTCPRALLAPFVVYEYRPAGVSGNEVDSFIMKPDELELREVHPVPAETLPLSIMAKPETAVESATVVILVVMEVPAAPAPFDEAVASTGEVTWFTPVYEIDPAKSCPMVPEREQDTLLAPDDGALRPYA